MIYIKYYVSLLFFVFEEKVFEPIFFFIVLSFAQGITLFEDLCDRNPEGKRDYIYYISIGHTKLKQYSIAYKYVKSFLELEPNNQQVRALEVSKMLMLKIH
jgi:hypothetical protein